MMLRFLGAAAVLAVITVGVLTYFFVVPRLTSTPTTTSLPSTAEGSGRAVVAASVSSLQLHLSVNTTSVTPGKSVLIKVYEFNPTRSVVNASAATKWASRALGVGVPPCAFENEPMSIAVAAGDFGRENFSTATPLQLVSESAVYNCPPLWNAKFWIFEPISNVTKLAGCLENSCSAEALVFPNQQEITASGTWTNEAVSQFRVFPPGIYTVVAGDEWGSVALLHFKVTG